MASVKKPDGWRVEIRRTSVGIQLVDGQPLEALSFNMMVSFVIIGVSMVELDGVNQLLALLALPQIILLRIVFRYLTRIDPWWADMLVEELGYRAKRWRRFGRKRRTMVMRAV